MSENVVMTVMYRKLLWCDPAGEWFPSVSKTLLTDFHNFFQENVSGIHEKQMAFSQYEILTIEQSVFSPENKSSEKQQ